MARPVTLKNIQNIEYFPGTSSYASIIGLSVPTDYIRGTGSGTSQILFSHDGTSFVNRGLCAGGNIQISYSDDFITFTNVGGGGGGTCYGVSDGGGLVLVNGTCFGVLAGQGINVNSAGVCVRIGNDQNLFFRAGGALGVSEILTGVSYQGRPIEIEYGGTGITSIGTSQFFYSADGTSISPIGLSGGTNIDLDYVTYPNFITINSTGGGGGSGGGTSPAGSNTQIQYNDNNSFGADASFTWTEGTSTLGVSGIVDVVDGPIILTESTGGVSLVVIEGVSTNNGADITLFENSTSAAPKQGMKFRTDGTTGENSIIINNFDGGGGITNTDGIIISSFDTSSGSNNPYIELNRNQNTNPSTNPDIKLLSDESGANASSKIIMNADTAGTGNGPYQTVSLESGAQNGVAAQGAALTMSSYDSSLQPIITLDTTTYQISINNSSGNENVLIQGEQGNTSDSGQITIKDGSNNDRITLKGSNNLIDFNNGGATLTFGMSGSQNATTSFILPTGSGNNGDVLSTDGNGNLSYTTPSSGGATDIDSLTDALARSDNLYLGNRTSNISSLTGIQNTAVGLSALYSNTSGTSNTAVGYNAGISITTGRFNTAFGSGALIKETTGLHSTAIGTHSLHNQNDTTSRNMLNSALGFKAGSGVTTGHQNTFIGACSGTSPNITGQNITCLGYGSEPSSVGVSNEVTLGNNQITALRCADTTIASLSDARDKNDIRDSTYGLNFLENIRPVEFTWDRRVLTPADEDDPKQGKRRVGFIAQELQEAMPDGENDILDLVYTSNPQRLEAKYGNLIPVMVKAIQDLKEEVDTIKEHLNLE